MTVTESGEASPKEVPRFVWNFFCSAFVNLLTQRWSAEGIFRIGPSLFVRQPAEGETDCIVHDISIDLTPQISGGGGAAARHRVVFSVNTYRTAVRPVSQADLALAASFPVEGLLLVACILFR